MYICSNRISLCRRHANANALSIPPRKDRLSEIVQWNGSHSRSLFSAKVPAGFGKLVCIMYVVNRGRLGWGPAANERQRMYIFFKFAEANDIFNNIIHLIDVNVNDVSHQTPNSPNHHQQSQFSHLSV